MGQTITKPEFAAIVAEKSGFTKADSVIAVNAILETITETLKKGDSVQFVGFGTFEVRNRAARTGVNPQTKKPINIPATKAVCFKVGKNLKAAVGE